MHEMRSHRPYCHMMIIIGRRQQKWPFIALGKDDDKFQITLHHLGENWFCLNCSSRLALIMYCKITITLPLRQKMAQFSIVHSNKI